MGLRWRGITEVRVWSADVAATSRAYATLFDGATPGPRVHVVPVPAGHDASDALAAVQLAVEQLDVEPDEDVARLLSRRGLPTEEGAGGVGVGVGVDVAGIPVEVVVDGAERHRPTAGTRDVTGLDHVVVRTADPDRALVAWAARLGLDLRLDRTNDQLGVRFLFLRAGADIVEVVAAAGGSQPSDGPGGPDRCGGLAWRTRDIEASRARLVAAGMDVSQVRTGRKPGTRVATVREPALCLPTLLIEQGSTAD